MCLGASNARAHEAKANQEALDELRGEKRAAARARRVSLEKGEGPTRGRQAGRV